jgi:BirA family biotin operon repressor/biotin-[acetyl-CoA-carboxylase] ligase
MPADDFPATTEVCTRLGWPAPQVVATTASTNQDLIGVAGDGRVRVALEQTAGRGRMDRQWLSRPGDGLTFSVRLNVPATVSAWGWIPLLAGVAVAQAVRAAGVTDVGLKWPNDVIGAGGKLAGILSVRDDSSAIVGIGLNLRFAGQRPDPDAVSVAELGGRPDQDEMLAGIVSSLHTWWTRFVGAAGDAQRCGLLPAYCDQCLTLGREVSVSGVDGVFDGFATGIDAGGRLLVRGDAGIRAVSAADVTLRA